MEISCFFFFDHSINLVRCCRQPTTHDVRFDAFNVVIDDEGETIAKQKNNELVFPKIEKKKIEFFTSNS